MMKRSIIAMLLLAVALSGCTSYRAYQQAQDLELQERWDEAVEAYSRALEVDPENKKYKMALQRVKLESSRSHFEKAKLHLAAGQYELAVLELRIATELDPTNQFAAVELVKASRALERARTEGNGETLEQMKRRVSASSGPPQLDPGSDEPISLSFPRETPVKDIYRALGNAFGINILFDTGLKDDRIAIELRDVTAQQGLERLMQAAGHFYKVLDERTIIVAPDNAQTRREYEDLVIRTFYLSNGDAEQVANVIRTMTEARSVFPLKALNAITIRDTADKVRIAERIIEANDKARAEVVVQVELLQMDLQKARSVGMNLTGLSRGVGAVLGTADDAGGAGALLTLQQIRDLGIDDIGFTIPSIAYSFVKNNSDTTLLAQPQLRITEGEKATLLIGNQIPIPVASIPVINTGGQQNFVQSTSYQYRDVGIKIAIEPRVHHNREISLRLTVEVSNVADAGTSRDGAPAQPTIGTRTIESTIRLMDGETNFLAGLIRQDESQGSDRIPFLGDLPVIGRLFGIDSKSERRTDLVLTLTPHIIRIPDITEADLAPMWVGTQGNLSFRGVSPRLESQAPGDPFTPERQQGSQFEAQPPAGVGTSEPAPQDPVYIPQGSAPSDPFRREPERERVEPAPPPPPPRPIVSPQQGEPQSSIRPPADPASDPTIGPQPGNLRLASGESRVWTIAGMDLEDVESGTIEIRYDPGVLSVADVVFGSAIAYDAAHPPAATIDDAMGSVRISSTNGEPLRFRSGGDIVTLRVTARADGETALVVAPLELRRDGRELAASIRGGRATVR